MPRTRSLIAAAGLLLALTGGLAAAQDPPPSTLLLILDASGSMWGQIEGENKIVIARRVLGGLVDGLADGSEVGVIAYGHRREGDCEDIETVVPMGPLDKGALKRTVDGLNPKGKTPITRSVERAFDALASRQGGATVILVSDGLETCGGDPCAAVRAAKERGIEFILHVVGFDVAGEDVSSLECAAQAGDGLFISAENAEELDAALDQAVAMPEIPDGRLSVKVVADGELQDAAVVATDAVSGEDAGGGRTYRGPDTNPRLIPLEDGKYQVEVQAVGLKGDVVRRFEVEIAGGSKVEKVVDYSTGELVVGVTRNGEPSDATYGVTVPESGEEVTRGRTYTGEKSNPARVRITSGTYEVTVGSVEITGRPQRSLGAVTVEPGGRAEVSHDWQSGTLKLGASRGGELVDATLYLVNVETGKAIGQGRTYTSASSNPKTFILEPGDYRVQVKEIRGERREITVTVGAGEVVERMVDPAGGG
jgi:Ca-activated chloride channel family protein